MEKKNTAEMKSEKFNFIEVIFSFNKNPNRIIETLIGNTFDVNGGLGDERNSVDVIHIPIVRPVIEIPRIHCSRYFNLGVNCRILLESTNATNKWGIYQSGSHSHIRYPGVAYKER